MARVFISHAGEDITLAHEVRRWLTGTDHEVFLDQDPRDGIVVGEQWRNRLQERLRWADAVVCVVTSAYLASTWCTAEVAAAQARGSRLLPLLAEPEVDHPLLAEFQHTELTRDRSAARTKLSEALRRIDDAGGAGWPDDRSPFPGLRPFDIDRHRVFFGRAEEVKQLTESVRAPAQDSVLLVVGPSGCGKSSLVRAGLVPVIAEEPGRRVLPPILPGDDPAGALARELAVASRRTELDWTVQQVRDRLAGGGLTALADELLLEDPDGPQQRLLIVLDQFEELLTQTAPADRAQFAELLRAALTGPVRIVATLRPDFLDVLLVDPALAALPTRTHTLRPLSREALRLVIDGPARLAGIDVDEHLVARLVDDTDTGEALPLLAFTLAQLADGVHRGGRLSTSRYEQIGGVQGALTRQADAALADAISTGGRHREEVVAGLLRLVTVDEQGHPTRWRVNRPELPTQVVTELDAFIVRRLLTTDTETTVPGTTVPGTTVIGIAHEAFLSAWSPLTQAVDANGSALRARRAVEQAAGDWDDHGRPRERLWSGDQLAAAVADTGARRGAVTTTVTAASRPRLTRWLPQWHRVLITDQVEMSPRAGAFLQASIRRDRSRRRRASTVLSVLLILAMVGAGFAILQQREAEKQLRIATARDLVAQAEIVRETNPRAALQLGVAAQTVHPDVETRANLISTLTSTHYVGTFTAHRDAVRSVVFIAHRPLMATGGVDGDVILWNTSDPARPRPLGAPLSGHGGTLWSVAASPDGQILATGNDNGTVMLWDLADPVRPRAFGPPLAGHDKATSSVAFSSDGRTLATGSFDGTVILWDVSDPARPHTLGPPLTAHREGVLSVAFAPGRPVLATGSDDDTTILWDVSDPARPRRLGPPLTGHSERVWTVAFSPDGRTLATGSFDSTVLLWDVSDPARPRRLGSPWKGHSEGVSSVAFTRDGRMLFTGSFDRTVILWDLTGPGRPRSLDPPLHGHTEGGVLSMAYSPVRDLLATGGDDDTTILWDVSDPARPRRLGPPLTGHSERVWTVAFSPDGRTLATGSFDSTVLLWDVSDPARPHTLGPPLTGHSDRVLSVAFSPDGRTLATGGYDDTTILWDVSEPARTHFLRQLSDHSAGDVHAVAFSSDSKTMAASGGDTVILWDVADPARPRPLGQSLTDQGGTVWSMTFSPDGKILAVGIDGGAVVLWNVADPSRPRHSGPPLTGQTERVLSVAFSPDGQTLATGSFHSTLILWDLTNRNRPRRLGEPLDDKRGEVSSVTFFRDGNILATGTYEGTVTLRRLTELNSLRQHATERACVLAGGGLDQDDWTRFIPGLPYQDTCAG